ncbi:zinc ribbon domain-containing protein [Lactiplantibacillus plajomi]|uniref:DUF6574 domain-containing protein n=1 Tax=Lactiplantibacillus plajomi TaxID=1457217 RepID=A0ABV6K4V1_9LACO|nr:zinc ribbon domain-containing protein [Lactiplantibacillus plajomi]
MKFCPNCGEQVDDDTRFCTHCGYDLQQATESAASTAPTATSNAAADTQPTQPTQPGTNANGPVQPKSDRVGQFQVLSKNYFQWFVESLKRPSEEVVAHKYFGLVSLLLSALLLTVAIVAAINRFIKQAAAATSSVLNVKTLSFGLDFKLFVLVVVGILFFVLIGFGASALGERDGRINFLDYVNRFAHLTNVGLILNVILIFAVYTITFDTDNPLNFIKRLGFAVVVAVILQLIWQVGLILSVNNTIHTERFNKFYVVLLAMLVLSLAFYVFFRIEGENLVLDFTSEFTNMFNNY